MKKRSILIVIVVLILLFLLLRQCAWKKNGNAEVAPVAGGGQPAAKSASSADNTAAFKRVMDAPLPTVVFTPPPAPPPPAPEPASEPVRPQPAPARPKVIRRLAAPAPRQSENTSRPALLPPRPESPAADNGLYYVVRRKVERNGTCYLVCSIMGDASNRYFGYAVSAEQYAKAELGLVYDNKNMTGWRRVNRIE